MAPNITFDTSCIVSLLGQDSTPNNELEALKLIKYWHDEQRAKIWVSEKSRTEASLDLERVANSEDEDSATTQKWKRTLDLLDEFAVIEGRLILGVSILGVDSRLGTEVEAKLYDEINNLTIPKTKKGERKLGDIFDTSILFEHTISNNDIFVTRDKMLLESDINKSLFEKYEITVCNPVEALEILKEKYGLN